MDAINWAELSYPFRVGNRHVYNPSDIRHIRGNDYFRDKFVRIRKKGLHEPKVVSDGHYDMLVDIYDIHEGRPGSGNLPLATKVHVDSSMCFFKAGGESKSKGKTRRKTTKKKRAKRSTKKAHKKRTHKRQRGGMISGRITVLDYDVVIRIMATMIHKAIEKLQSATQTLDQIQAFESATQVMSDVSQMVDIRVNSPPEIISELVQQLSGIIREKSEFTLAELTQLPHTTGTQLMFPSLCTTCYCPDIGAQIHVPPMMAPTNAPDEFIYMIHLAAYMRDECVSNAPLSEDMQVAYHETMTKELLKMLYDPDNDTRFTLDDSKGLITEYIASESNAVLAQAADTLEDVPQWLGDVGFSAKGTDILQKLLTTFICHPLTFDITEPCKKSLDVRIKLIESLCNYTHLTLSDQSNLQSTQRLYTMIDLVISPAIVLMNGGRGQLPELPSDAGGTAAGRQNDSDATVIAYKNLALAKCLLTEDSFTETLPIEIIAHIGRHLTNTHPAISHARNVVACLQKLMGNISRNLQQGRYTFYGITGIQEQKVEREAATIIQSIVRGVKVRRSINEICRSVGMKPTREEFLDAVKDEISKNP